MAIKHIFCRFLASLALFFVTANLFAAGYTKCDTSPYYYACHTGYYLIDSNGKYTNTPQGGNTCRDCPTNAYCPGNTFAPVYTVTLNHNGGYAGLSQLYATYKCTSSSCGAAWFSNLNKQTTGSHSSISNSDVSHIGTVVSGLTTSQLPTRTGYTFQGYYTAASGGNQIIGSTGSINYNNYQGSSELTLYAQWKAISKTCLAGQYFNKTECADCTSGYYCPNGSKEYTYNGSIQGRSDCPDGYKNSPAKATAQTQCYVTTTAGNYIANANDSTQTKCAENDYCTGDIKINYGKTGGNTKCPDPKTYAPTDLPSDYVYIFGTYANWGLTLSSIEDCRAVFGYTTDMGYVTYESVHYDNAAGRYDLAQTANIYWGAVEPGYYLHTKYMDNYCEIDSGHLMYYRYAEACPADYYCPGGNVPKCNSGSTYEATFGKFTCPTNSSTNGNTGQASCTCNTGYNYNDGTTTTTNACEANTYTIKYNSDGGSSVSNTKCTYGKSCTVSSEKPTKTGYTFAGWKYTSATYQLGATINTSLTSTNGAVLEFVAQWTANKYTIKYDKNGGSGTQMDNTTCTYGTNCTLSANTYTKTGYTFNGWKNGNDEYNDKESVSNLTTTNNGTVTLVAQWKPITFTIIYVSDNVSIPQMPNTICTYDTDCYITENKFTKLGYTFKNWANNDKTKYFEDGANLRNASSSQGVALFLHAQWEPIIYTIKYDANGGDGNMENQICKYDQSCTLTANEFTKTGYKFNGWKNGENKYTDKESVSNLTTTNNGTVTLVAQWTPITFMVIYSANDGSGTQMDNTKCTYDSDCYITKNTYTKTGYTFKNWANSDNSKTFSDGENVKNARTTDTTLFLYAQWEPITYTIRYNANGGDGSMTDKQCVYDTDCKLDANTFTKTGHSFVGWLYGGTKYQDQETLPNLTTENGAVLKFVAQWSKNARTCEPGKYLDGDDCKTCPVNSYCGGGTWEYNGDIQGLEKCPAKSSTNGATGQTFCTCNAGYNYNNATETTSGTCVGNDFTITYDLNGGSGNVQNTVCTNGNYCVVSTTKPTKKGYNFAGWLYNSKKYESGAPFSELISTNGETITFTAKWEPITYIIRYDADGGYGHMEDTTCTYDQLCYLRENNYTKTGHRFVHWWVNDYAAGEYVDKAATQQDAIVIAKAYWLPIQIPCPAGQYLDGLNCKDCENEYYCEGSEAEGWSNGWVYDGGIHGRKDCPETTETYGAVGKYLLDVIANEPHKSIDECRATFEYAPQWYLDYLKEQGETIENILAGYDPQANNRGMYFVSCDYNSDTKQYDSNCTGFPLFCDAGYVSSTNVDLATDFEDLSKNLYYANSPQDAIEKTCVPVGRNNWSPSGQECIGLPDDEAVFCLYEKSLEKNACPDGGITLTNTAGAITDCLKNDIECTTELGDGIKTCSYDEVTGAYDNCDECSVNSCKPGYYMNNGVCATCPAGSACSDNNITTCGANTWSTVGGTQCNACPANSSTNGATGQTQCVCNDGYTTNGKFDGSTTTTTQACIKTDINVSYDVNGGVGRLGGHTCPAGADCTLLTPSDIGNQMYRAGYVFIGWGDKANATTPVNPVFNTDVTLYAIWNACAAGTYKTADAALDAQCSLCAVLDNSGMYPNTNSVASTSASACYMTCKDKTVSGGVAHPTDVNVYYPNVCEYKTGTSINGNTCEIVNDKCIEVSCNFDYEMIDGICHPCNRENATEYKKTGNCIVAKCRYGYHPNGQSCQSDTIECTAPNAVSASQKWDTKTGAYGICTVTKCDAGYHIVANACQPDEQTCELEHGIGWREWDEKKNDWGKCVATYCEPGYTNDPDLTNESWEQCGRCNNMYGTRGELVVSSYVQGCEIAACMHQGEHFILENNECRDICETYSDETGSRKWNGSRCVHTCNEGYTNW